MCSLLYIIVIHTNNFTDKIKPIFFTSRIFNFFEELQPQRETSMARTPTQSLFRVEKLKTFEMTVTLGTISIP